MGQQHVQEVEGRPAADAAGAEPRDKPFHAAAAIVPPALAPGVLERRRLQRREVGPGLRYRWERPGQIIRQHRLEPDDAEITQHRAEPRQDAGTLDRAKHRRAEAGERLDHLQAVARPEQREEIIGVVVHRRQPAALRVAPGQDGGQRETGGGADRARVAEPGRLVRQRREVGISGPVDGAVAVEERGERQLIEDHHNNRRRRLERDPLYRAAVRVGRRQQRRDRRVEQEDRGHDQRRGREERSE